MHDCQIKGVLIDVWNLLLENKIETVLWDSDYLSVFVDLALEGEAVDEQTILTINVDFIFCLIDA